MVVLIKERLLRGLNDTASEEKTVGKFPETDLLKRCTKMKASGDGKKVDLLTNDDKILGSLNREDDAHCNLDLADGNRIVGRYTTTSSDVKPTWTVYETNKTSKKRIIDEERVRMLKGLFNDMRNAAETALKSEKDVVCFRNRCLSRDSHSM